MRETYLKQKLSSRACVEPELRLQLLCTGEEKRNLTLVRDPEGGRRQEGRLLAQAKGDFTGDHERVMGIAESSLHGKWYNTLHFL